MTQKIGRTIGFTTEDGPKWGFVLVDKDKEQTFDDHVADGKLDIAKKGDTLSVKFNDSVIGEIVHTQEEKYTEEQKNEICTEHGLFTAVEHSAEESDTTEKGIGDDDDGPNGPG